jgi:hypothetical protein
MFSTGEFGSRRRQKRYPAIALILIACIPGQKARPPQARNHDFNFEIKCLSQYRRRKRQAPPLPISAPEARLSAGNPHFLYAFKKSGA